MEIYNIEYGNNTRPRPPVDIGNGKSFPGIRSGVTKKTRGTEKQLEIVTDGRYPANRMLANLPDKILSKLQPYMKTACLLGEDYLYQPDDQMNFIYFPESAVLSEFQMLEDGRTIEVGIIGRESAVGISSVFSRCQSINWVQVCVEGTAVRVDAEVFKKAVAHDYAVQGLLHDHIHSYIRQISQKVICNTHHSVEERFCTWLLMLQERCKNSTLKLTQEHIARVLGVYRPSVTCIAQSLRDKKVIDYVRGRISITSREGLKKYSCGCYTEFSKTYLLRPHLEAFSSAVM